MRCYRCRHTTNVVEHIEGPNSRQTRFVCPVCECSQTLTEPVHNTFFRRIGNAQRFSGFALHQPDRQAGMTDTPIDFVCD